MMNRRIEVANGVPRNGISKTYFSYSYLFTSLLLVTFLRPINRLHKNGFIASMVAPQLEDNLLETLSFLYDFSLMRKQTIQQQYTPWLINAIYIHGPTQGGIILAFLHPEKKTCCKRGSREL